MGTHSDRDKESLVFIQATSDREIDYYIDIVTMEGGFLYSTDVGHWNDDEEYNGVIPILTTT